MQGQSYIETHGHKRSFGMCPECEESEKHCDCYAIDFHYDDEDWQDDDVCCWDIRYKGPKDYCHCQAYQEAQDREAKWGWILRPIENIKAIPFRVSTWWWKFKRKYLPQSVVCDNCNHQYSFIGNEPKCPECGNYNLPF